MKRTIFTLLLLMVFTQLSAEELPKIALGNFGGEMPSYTALVDGNEITIDKHDIFVTITESEIIYTGGDLKMTGTYTAFKQSKSEYTINAHLTNGKSVEYHLDLIWDKRSDRITIAAKNGQSEAELERLD